MDTQKWNSKNEVVMIQQKYRKTIYCDKTETNIIYRRHPKSNRTHKIYTNFSETYITFLNVQITFFNGTETFVEQTNDDKSIITRLRKSRNMCRFTFHTTQPIAKI